VTLTRLNAAGYAGASWERSSAQVQAAENRVDVDLVVESGPLYRFGELRVEGASRYDVDIVRRLATFAPGDAYSDQTLRDFQERLIKVGLYEGASVELDPDPKTSAAAPVIVRVREFALQQATVGVGYSTDTAERITLEHTHRRAFGAPWVAHQKLQLGSELQSWEGSLTSYPRDGLYRDLVSGSVSRLRSADQVVDSWNARVGRSQDTERLERLYYLEYTHTRLEDGPLTNQAVAAWFNYQWVFRNLDSILLPTRGVTASAQTGAGYARGTVTLSGNQVDSEQGPFARLYARLTWYKPIGTGWFATARVEAGQVFTQSVAGVPDNVLFRAGGDDSVRGYGYRTLGPQAGGVTLSGRTLLTGSLEVARPILAAYPAYWWAAFVDAGNAADRWSALNPALGYGLGLRWRSPVGPLRFDVAYGQRLSQVRTYLSVGIVF
jgi:translocation and assembly module TamA